MSLLMCVSCSVLIMFTRPLASFLFAKDFYNAWQYVPLLLVCSVINGAAGFIGPILSAVKDSKTMTKSAVWSSVTNIVLNVILTYFMGVQGAVIATVVSSYVIYIYRKRATGDKIVSNFYSAIMLSWMLLLIQSFVEIYLQSYFVQPVFLAAIVVLLRKPLLKCLEKIRIPKSNL